MWGPRLVSGPAGARRLTKMTSGTMAISCKRRIPRAALPRTESIAARSTRSLSTTAVELNETIAPMVIAWEKPIRVTRRAVTMSKVVAT